MSLRHQLRRQNRKLENYRPPIPAECGHPEGSERGVVDTECGHWTWHAHQKRWVHAETGMWGGVMTWHETEPCPEETELGELS